MADVFDDLATILKLAKGKVEEAQYAAEKCRSELVAVRKAAKVCDGHDAAIADLRAKLVQTEASLAQLYKENSSLTKKLQQISSFLT